MDRRAVGETLSADDLDFCGRFTAAHPACQRELDLLEELGELDVAPSADAARSSTARSRAWQLKPRSSSAMKSRD